MKKSFGTLPSGEATFLYTISCGKLSAAVTDYGATLVSLLVPDRDGVTADVVLGYDDCNGYRTGNGACLGATVGRNANRLKGASHQEPDDQQHAHRSGLCAGRRHFHLGF